MTPAAWERLRLRWPVLLTSAAAWGLLAIYPLGMATSASHAGGGSRQMVAGPDRPELVGLGWVVMLVAMMAPLLPAQIRHVSHRSFSHRRGRSTSLLVAGYASVWMAAGPVLGSLSEAMRTVFGDSSLALTALAALIWQFSPIKQICLNRRHIHPSLSAFGVRADLDALRFGLTHGFWCLGSCWCLMLLPTVSSGGHLALMGVVSLWMWGEHFERPSKPGWRPRGPAKAVRLVLAQARIFLGYRVGGLAPGGKEREPVAS